MRRVTAVLCIGCLLMGLFGGCSWAEDPVKEPAAEVPVTLGFQFDPPKEGEEFAIIHTEGGDVYVRLFPEHAPKAVENFKTLAKSGYYDGVLFHRIIDGMFVQTGDPTGTGTGGESCWGGWFEDEFSDVLGHFRGSLAMANGGIDLNGSQFFINQSGLELMPVSAERAYYEEHAQALTDYASFEEYFAAKVEYITGDTIDPTKLTAEILQAYDTYGGNIALDSAVRYEGGYTVFGQVFRGMSVIDEIAAVEVDSNQRPTELVCIESIEFAVYRTTFFGTVSPMVEEKNTVTVSEKAFGFQMEPPAVGEEIAVISTTVGDMSVRLFPEEAPKAVENFKALAKDGFYDDVTFLCADGEYSVVDDMEAQSEYFTAGESSFGGTFEDELNTALGNLYGSVAMTNSGVNSNGSRFFINHGKDEADMIASMREYYTASTSLSPYYADFASFYADEAQLHIGRTTEAVVSVYEQYGGNPEYDGPLHVTGGNTVFGQIFEGLDVFEKINTAQTDESYVPVEDIRILEIRLETYNG